MVNMDHGILPAAIEEVRADIGLENTQMGFMGSVVYLGLVIGKFIAILSCSYRITICYPSLQRY